MIIDFFCKKNPTKKPNYKAPHFNLGIRSMVEYIKLKQN